MKRVVMRGCHIIFVSLVLIFALPYISDAGDTDLEKNLQKGLEQSRSIVERAKKRLADGRSITHELNRLTTIAEDISASHLLLQERFRSREDQVMGMGANAPDRHRAMSEGYMRALEEYLTLIESFPTEQEVSETILDDLKTLLDRILYKKKTLIFGSLPYRSLNYPAREPAEAPTIKPAYKGGNKTVSPEDLKSTLEAPISEEIAVFAESLEWNPVLIYEWVKNNVETEWYWGCMKGAEETLKQKSGNDCDQAALLIALLRASGFPSRYVRGVIEFFPDMETIQNLTGIEDPQEIAGFFQKAGLPYKPVVTGGRIANFQIEHIWVESQIPFANFHGAVVDEHGKAWLGLDTSIKVTGYTYNDPADILQELSLSETRDEYLSTLQDQTPLEYIRAQIEAYLAENDPDTVYEDLLRTKTLVPEVMNILPASLQYKQILITHEYAEIPDELIHKVKFTATTRNSQPATDNLFDITLETLAVSNQQIAISYEPETVEDHEIINLYGGLDNTPAYLVRLRPVLKVNAENVVVSQDGLSIGAEYDLTIELVSPNSVEKITNTHIAGNYAVIGIVSGKSIALDAVPDEEKNAWRILYEEAISYIDRWNQAEEELASLMQLTITRPIPTVVTLGGVLDVTYLLDTPHGFEWKGVYVDADIRVIETAISSQRSAVSQQNTDDRQKTFMQLSSLQGSILENKVLEEDLLVESISTAKLFQLANDSQIPILTIDKDNLNSILPTLPFAEGIKEDIENAVNQGLEVRIPKSEIVYEDWTGIGYITEDPETGASGWMLSGMIAGGMTVGGWSEGLVEIFVSPYSKKPNTDPKSAGYIYKIPESDLQKGAVGEKLQKSLKVMVFDNKRRPVKGAKVTFHMLAGGGTFETTPTPFPVPFREVTTNSKGIATVTFVLGKKTEDNPAYVWKKSGDVYRQRVGENIVDAYLTDSGTSIKKPFTAYGYPKEPKQMRKLHGDGITGNILDFAGFVSVGIEDEYGNPISNLPVDFNALPANELEVCSNPNHDPRASALLVDGSDLCFDTKISPSWGECKSQTTHMKDVTDSRHGAAVAHIILGGIPDAEYPIKATYKTLSQTFWRYSYPFGSCHYSSLTPDSQILVKYVYPVDDYGVNINGAKAGEQITVKARLAYLAEGPSEHITERLTCPNPEPPSYKLVYCTKITGSRRYIVGTNFNQATVKFSGQSGTHVGSGVYKSTYKLKSGLNTISIDASGILTRIESDNNCENSPVCGYKSVNKVMEGSTSMYIYGVDVQAKLGPDSFICVDELGYSMKNHTITSEITPSKYKAESAYVVIKKNGHPIQYIETEPTGNSEVTLLEGYWFDIHATYAAEAVLNIGRMHEGKSLEIRSKEIPLTLVSHVDRLHLRPVIIPVVTPPGSKQLKVVLEPGNCSAAQLIDVSADAHTTYEWIGNSPGNVIGGAIIQNVINKIKAKMQTLGLGVDFKLIDPGDMSVDGSGKLTVNSPGIQVIRAVYEGNVKSDYAVVLAGLKLKEITLVPISTATISINLVGAAFGAELNTPLILAPKGNGSIFIPEQGGVKLDDVVFEYLGQGTISLDALINAIKPLIEKVLTAAMAPALGPVSVITSAVAASVITALLDDAVDLVATQALNMSPSDSNIVTVSNTLIKGIARSVNPGLAGITGTLDLKNYGLGEASDTVLTWVLPNLESVRLEPKTTLISIFDPPTPGPKVSTFGLVKALNSAPITMPKSFKTVAEYLDKLLPGGLAAWGSGNIDTLFHVGDFTFRIRGSYTTSSDAVTFKNVQIEFVVPNTFPITNNYLIHDPSIAKTGDVKTFHVHIVHQGKAGETPITAQVGIVGLTSSDPTQWPKDTGKIVVTDKCLNDAHCDDGDLCTDDVCGVDGSCTHLPIDCSSLDSQCTAGVCNPTTGKCEAKPINEGLPCIDGLFCTVNDVCTGGRCVGVSRDCSDGISCTDDICDEAADKCVHTSNDALCDDGNVCTDDLCDAVLGCQYVPNTAQCDDGNLCTQNDQCSGGVCAGTPVDCSSLDSQCIAGVCNPTTGKCEAKPINEGLPCTDGLFCTVNDVCTGGRCVAVPRDCSGMADQCNSGVCDEATDQCLKQHRPDGTVCNDGNPGTFGDVCVQGVCSGIPAGSALRIDEVVTDPQSDWSNGSGTPFDASPGSGAVNDDDEYVEIRNTGSATISIRDMVLVMTDTTPANYTIGSGGASVEVYSAGSNADTFLPGGILVIGNPPGEMDDDIVIEIEFGGLTGLVLADVQLGGSGAPGGGATGTADEAVRRVNTTGNDSVDFTRGAGDPGVATGPP